MLRSWLPSCLLEICTLIQLSWNIVVENLPIIFTKKLQTTTANLVDGCQSENWNWPFVGFVRRDGSCDITDTIWFQKFPSRQNLSVQYQRDPGRDGTIFDHIGHLTSWEAIIIRWGLTMLHGNKLLRVKLNCFYGLNDDFGTINGTLLYRFITFCFSPVQSVYFLFFVFAISQKSLLRDEEVKNLKT